MHNLPILEAKDCFMIVNMYNTLFPKYEIELYEIGDEVITDQTKLFIIGDWDKDLFVTIDWYQLCLNVIVSELANRLNISFTEFLQLYNIPEGIKIIPFLNNIILKLDTLEK